MRLFFHTTRTAQDWHRAYLPVLHLAPRVAAEGINIVLGSELTLDYDAFVFARQPPAALWPFLSTVKYAGKKLIWNFDDDLWNIPKWNPASRYIDLEIVNWMKDNADDVWVSTEYLQGVVGRGRVLPNLVDRRFWPSVPRSANDRLRILWAGSAYHAPDLEMVAAVFDRLLSRYDNILCLYFGAMPACSGEWVQVPGSNYATLVPHARYAGRLGFVAPVDIEEYPRTLVNINADIGLAAVVDEPFSYSKSNLKFLEYSMAGMATVASDLPPYQGTTALLGDLYENCCRLIEDEKLRQDMMAQAKEEVRTWTWDSARADVWLEAIREAVS